ncbi:MAG TPA: hypothetical protein VI322_01715 [Candidatus Saccharimonadia bacterium]
MTASTTFGTTGTDPYRPSQLDFLLSLLEDHNPGLVSALELEPTGVLAAWDLATGASEPFLELEFGSNSTVLEACQIALGTMCEPSARTGMSSLELRNKPHRLELDYTSCSA